MRRYSFPVRFLLFLYSLAVVSYALFVSVRMSRSDVRRGKKEESSRKKKKTAGFCVVCGLSISPWREASKFDAGV
jgi:hypothetical protein